MESTELDTLQAELEFYRQNQATMEQEIRSVIGDNQRLSHQVGMLLQERMHASRVADQSKTEDLRVQFTLLAKERDSLHVLWKASQKTVDALEAELKTYQNYDDGGQMHKDRRDLELKLETALTDYLELETKHKELTKKHASLENELKVKEKEINSYNERGKELEVKTEELNKTLEELRVNLAAEKKSNEELRTQLHLCQRESVDMIKREMEAKSKVAEALQLFDVVSAQKNEAYKKIAEITEYATEVDLVKAKQEKMSPDELIQTKQSLAMVKRDTEQSWRAQLDETKQWYNEKVADMLAHIRNLDCELVEKGMLLNKALREVKILHDANENYIKQREDGLKSVDPRLALAEKKLETMFQELVASERRNILLVSEKQCLAIDIQRIQDTHAREIKRRDWEEKLLRTQCQELKVQVEHLQKSLEETHGMVDKLQDMLSSRAGLTQKMVSTKEEELSELNKHLEKQMELSKRWKESYVEMSDKLRNKLEEMKNENKELRNKLRLSATKSPAGYDSGS